VWTAFTDYRIKNLRFNIFSPATWEKFAPPYADFYGLGNFIFDQTWDLGHQQGVMLLLHFNGTDYAGYDLIPTHVDGDGTVHFAGADEAAQILQRIEEASERLR